MIMCEKENALVTDQGVFLQHVLERLGAKLVKTTNVLRQRVNVIVGQFLRDITHHRIHIVATG